MVSKYLDHQLLYRQCQIAARAGVQFSESALGDWVGGVHHLGCPLLAALNRYVFQAAKLHTDDTPINVLTTGTGKTRQARLWVYTRDDRGSGDTAMGGCLQKYYVIKQFNCNINLIEVNSRSPKTTLYSLAAEELDDENSHKRKTVLGL